ncbi:MFS transporter, partial [Burkholderia cepacia]
MRRIGTPAGTSSRFASHTKTIGHEPCAGAAARAGEPASTETDMKANEWDTSYEWKAVTLLALGFGLVGLD